MTRTADRTLLASLGFQDTDRRTPKHTLACQYLSEPENAQRLLDRYKETWLPAGEAPGPTTVDRDGRHETQRAAFLRALPRLPRATTSFNLTSAVMETPIYKSHGYLVGFWDVVVKGELGVIDGWTECGEISVDEDCQWSTNGKRAVVTGWHAKPFIEAIPRNVCIEVKAGRTDISEVCKQLALYQSFTSGSVIVLATCYPLTRTEKSNLHAKGIRHILLGKKFDEYVEARKAEQPVVEDDF